MKKKVLYVTYDGINDKLGKSQILPYLKIINKIKNVDLSLISFEKDKPLEFDKKRLEKIVIKWNYLKFTKKSYFLIKIIDFIKITFYPIVYSLNNKIDILHCRGHLPSIPALFLKIFFKKKFIFDFRGLWADERVDNNNWDQKKTLFKLTFIFFKFLESLFIKKSDHIIVLTNNIKSYLINRYKININKVTVIPTVTDYSKFKIFKNNYVNFLKKKHRLNKNDLIIGYFGSISKIYMPDEMISFFLESKKKYTNPIIIFFSDNFEYLKGSKNFKLLKNKDYILISPKFEDIQMYYNICDLTLCFVIRSFARIASSPTKIGESLACGVPVLCNKGVGDLDKDISFLYRRGVINVKKNIDINNSFKSLNSLINIKKKYIRNKSKSIFDLNNVDGKYLKIYKKLINSKS